MSDVPLREYFDSRIDALSSHIDTRFSAIDAALRLQAAEYERRLELLNNEAVRLLSIESKTVTRDTCDLLMQESGKRVGRTEKMLFLGIGILIVLEILFRGWVAKGGTVP